MRARVAKRHELARQKLASGNYPGFQAAELLYRQILTERDDPPARALRARVLAQMAFEFGDSPEPARARWRRSATTLRRRARQRPGCEDAAEARIYLAMARASSIARRGWRTALRRKYPRRAGDAISSGAPSCCSSGPRRAVDALRAAADREPRDPLVLHALGLAEAAAQHDDRALEAYRRALEANANHIATIVDRALLQVRRGAPIDRDAARGALEGVVGKLVGDCVAGAAGARVPRARPSSSWQKRRPRGGAARAGAGGGQAARRRRAAVRGAGAGVRARLQLDEAEREAKRAHGRRRAASRRGWCWRRWRCGAARPQQALAVIEEAGDVAARGAGDARAGVAAARPQARRRASTPRRRCACSPICSAAKVALARVDIADGQPERGAARARARSSAPQKSAEVAAALAAVFAAEQAARSRALVAAARRSSAIRSSLEARLAAGARCCTTPASSTTRATSSSSSCGSTRPTRRRGASWRGWRSTQGDAVAARDQFDALAEEDPDVDDAARRGARAPRARRCAPGADERVERGAEADAERRRPSRS